MKYQLWTADNGWCWILDTELNKRTIRFVVSKIVETFEAPLYFTFKHDVLVGDYIIAESDSIEQLPLLVPWLFI